MKRIRGAGEQRSGTTRIDTAITDDMAQRLQGITLINAVVLLFSVGMGASMSLLGDPLVPFTVPVMAPRAFGIALSLGVWWLLRSGRLSGARAIAWCPYYEVGFSLVIAYSEQIVRAHLGGPALASWLATWVVLMRVFVPYPRRVALLTSLASALMLPAGAGLTALSGLAVHWVSLVPVTSVTLVVSLAAVVASSLMRRMQAEVSQARELGSYELGEELGRGGMGVVWRARHRLLKREAAIKVINPGTLLGAERAAGALRRFEREARITASLRSRNTIEIYDFGPTDDGAFYYVMELLDGVDLSQLVRDHGPQPPARVAAILTQAARSLGEAHAADLVHRDVKPANLFLCRCGPELDIVKVMDFGLVTELPAAAEATAAPGVFGVLDGTMDGKLTLEGSICGTPEFMAPEVGRGERADARSDIYSLGCVGYWLLAGRPALSAPNSWMLILAHIEQQPEPPSALLGAALPASLEAIVMDCLAKDPAQRPQNGAELERRLEACALAGWTASDARAWWERRAAAAATLASRGGSPPSS